MKSVIEIKRNAKECIAIESDAIERLQERIDDDSIVAVLASNDIDENDSHTYSLISGSSDDDNNSFTLDGNTLKERFQITEGPWIGKLMLFLCKERAFGRLHNSDEAFELARNWLEHNQPFYD